MTDSIPTTANETWGFYGTSGLFADADAAWAAAVPAVAKATGNPPEIARDFLDSRHGRHFADDVYNGISSGVPLEAAINAAIDRWNNWTISRRTGREYGIPTGLPYLTGFVSLYAVVAGTI